MPSHPFLLVTLVSLATCLNAAAGQNLSTVACPSTQTTFTAVTEMIFEKLPSSSPSSSSSYSRSSTPGSFTPTERRELTVLLKQVYNGLAASKCDAFFRRIQNMIYLPEGLDSLQTTTATTAAPTPSPTATTAAAAPTPSPTATTTNGGAWTTGTHSYRSPPGNHHHRSLQDNNSINVNTTSTTDDDTVQIAYQVVGTCRDCPVTSDGSFELYDDAFRRHRQLVLTTSTNDNQEQAQVVAVRHVRTKVDSCGDTRFNEQRQQ